MTTTCKSYDLQVTQLASHTTCKSHNLQVKWPALQVTWPASHITCESHNLQVKWPVSQMTCELHDLWVTWPASHMTCKSHDLLVTWPGSHMTASQQPLSPCLIQGGSGHWESSLMGHSTFPTWVKPLVVRTTDWEERSSHYEQSYISLLMITWHDVTITWHHCSRALDIRYPYIVLVHCRANLYTTPKFKI